MPTPSELEASTRLGVYLLVDLDRVNDGVATRVENGLGEENGRRPDIRTRLDQYVATARIEEHQRGVIDPTPPGMAERPSRARDPIVGIHDTVIEKRHESARDERAVVVGDPVVVDRGSHGVHSMFALKMQGAR